MKVNRSTITIAVLSIIDLVIGTVVISKCFFQQEIDHPIVYEAKMEIVEDLKDLAPVASVVEKEEPIIVYDDMTLDELSEKLNRVLTSTLEGTGSHFATKSLELGVDPYLAVAIVLHETGCKWNCSSLVRYCNNVGGMKGAPGCNGGSYKAFNTLEEGIDAFLENLANNYYAYGLTTPEAINKKYAASTSWASKINYYINYIKNS
ncbi:MAG: glucosaminidase domain-containing protein [Tenericutes bacterium]|nr:glucosaminidase domain-containing protein [Mycoplasmatota bacterium]